MLAEEAMNPVVASAATDLFMRACSRLGHLRQCCSQLGAVVSPGPQIAIRRNLHVHMITSHNMQVLLSLQVCLYRCRAWVPLLLPYSNLHIRLNGRPSNRLVSFPEH